MQGQSVPHALREAQGNVLEQVIGTLYPSPELNVQSICPFTMNTQPPQPEIDVPVTMPVPWHRHPVSGLAQSAFGSVPPVIGQYSGSWKDVRVAITRNTRSKSKFFIVALL